MSSISLAIQLLHQFAWYGRRSILPFGFDGSLSLSLVDECILQGAPLTSTAEVCRPICPSFDA